MVNQVQVNQVQVNQVQVHQVQGHQVQVHQVSGHPTQEIFSHVATDFPTASTAPTASTTSASAAGGGISPGWVKGLALCAFTGDEVLTLVERMQRFLGPLACRTVSPEQLFSHAPPRSGELLLLPLRHTSDPALVWLYELRQRGVQTPVLVVRSGMDFIPTFPLESLGAVDFISYDNASDFDLWRCLGLLKRAYQRELILHEISNELESVHTELSRRRREVGYLTFSLAGREIDEELIGDRVEEKTLTQIRKRIRRSENFGVPLTCFSIGIDDMDEIMSRYGSAFAAFVLVQIAYRLKRVLREGDFLARYGEDGFLLLSQGTSNESVRSHARTLMSAVTAAPLEDNGHALLPTVSIGAVRYRREMTTSGELLDAAKIALATARGQGRRQLALI